MYSIRFGFILSHGLFSWSCQEKIISWFNVHNMTAHTKQHFVVVVYRFQSAYAQSSYFHLKLIHDRSLSTQPFIFFDLMVLNSCRTMRISLHCQLFLTKRTPTWIHRKKQSGGKWYHHDQWLLLIDMGEGHDLKNVFFWRISNVK